MDHGEVETFLHEFGHLMHSLLARQRVGRHQRCGHRVGLRRGAVADAGGMELGSGGAAGFARHYETDEPIPAGPRAPAERATEFGRELDMRTQMAYARISLLLHGRAPAQVDTDSVVAAVTAGRTRRTADGRHPLADRSPT